MKEQQMWACLVRPSSRSSILVKLPFLHNEVDPLCPDDQIKMGQWCLDSFGGSWIPTLYARGIESEMRKAQEDFADMWSFELPEEPDEPW